MSDLEQAKDYLRAIMREVRDKDAYRVAEAARNLQTVMDDYLSESDLDDLAKFSQGFEPQIRVWNDMVDQLKILETELCRLNGTPYYRSPHICYDTRCQRQDIPVPHVKEDSCPK